MTKLIRKQVRVDRYLANAGYGTRTEVTRLIKRGLVTVDGIQIRSTSTRISGQSIVEVDGIAVIEDPAVLIWHKPVGIQCTVGDPLGRPSLVECAPADYLDRYHPVGRLDADTSGILILSRFGDLTQRLLHPKHKVPRCYRATAQSTFSNDHAMQLESGVETSIGIFRAVVQRIEDNEIELIVTEGKHRMVRRMLANIGQPVETLQRINYGPFILGDLETDEVRAPSTQETEGARLLSLPGFEL